MMKNGVCFIVKVLLVEFIEMTCDVILWTQKDVKSQKMEYLGRLASVSYTHLTLPTKLEV